MSSILLYFARNVRISRSSLLSGDYAMNTWEPTSLLFFWLKFQNPDGFLRKCQLVVHPRDVRRPQNRTNVKHRFNLILFPTIAVNDCQVLRRDFLNIVKSQVHDVSQIHLVRIDVG